MSHTRNRRSRIWVEELLLYSITPSTYEKTDPYQKKVMSETPKCGLYSFANCRPCNPLLNNQHGRLWRSFALLGSKSNRTAHLCPPCLSTMTRRVYTGRLSFPQWHRLTQTHFPPRSRKTAWHSDITFRKLYIAVSLMKNHYSNKGFCRGKGRRPFDLEVFGIVDPSLIKDFIYIYIYTYFFWLIG